MLVNYLAYEAFLNLHDFPFHNIGGPWENRTPLSAPCKGGPCNLHYSPNSGAIFWIRTRFTYLIRLRRVSPSGLPINLKLRYLVGLIDSNYLL
jgi:hypothetical protein